MDTYLVTINGIEKEYTTEDIIITACMLNDDFNDICTEFISKAIRILENKKCKVIKIN